MLTELGAGLGAGDLVAFVGAGDIDLMAREWLAARTWDGRARSLGAELSAATTLRREEPLARKTTMGIGGAAALRGAGESG